MAAVPDMSHLTPEERSTIEEVMTRHKEEEEKENEIMRRKQNEVKILEERIRACSEQHKKAGVELNATCHICLKTKFADGVGHICNYCRIRCCARCGGKVTLRSGKVTWVCILCRKKQELLSKTGQWMMKTGPGSVDNATSRLTPDMQVGGPPGLVDQTQDKRPKLERAHSAAEKENLPLLQRGGSLLRRQYSQQEQVPGRRLSTSDSGVEMSVSPHSRTLPTPRVTVGSYPVQQPPRHPAVYHEDDPNLYRGEIDGLMRQYPQNYQRQRPIYSDQTELAMAYGQPPMEAGPPRTTIHPVQQHSMQGPHPSQPPIDGQGSLQQQRSFSSSEEERSTPECPSDEPDESEKGDKPSSMGVTSWSTREQPADRMNRQFLAPRIKNDGAWRPVDRVVTDSICSTLDGYESCTGKGYYHHTGDPMSMSASGRRHHGSHNGHHNADAMTAEFNGHHPPREPRKEENTIRRSFRRTGDEWRSDSRRFTERRGKKTVRFDGGTNVGGSQEDWSWEADRQGSQDSATKDSGIDTSSNFTSSEDSNRSDLPKRSLSWQPSRDGQKLIGHMVLRKQTGSGSSSSILGLKVVGGKLLGDGSVGALIERVKKGSTADIEGQLRPGDEVIKWNGRTLQGKSFREVCEIIAASRQEPQVELVVSRNLSGAAPMPAGPTPPTPMTSRRIGPQSQWRQKHENMPGPQQPHHKELYDARREKPSVLVTSPGSPDLHAQGRARHLRQTAGNANVGGKLQVKLSYDSVTLRLIVTLVCAAGLTPRSNGQPRNPYAKIFLLPEKSEQSKRRTNTLANTNDPKWNQTFVYDGIRGSELRKRALEITVWDYGRCDANDFLGEVVIDLGIAPLRDELEVYPLTAHEEHRHISHYQEPDDMVITPMDRHLSPPSTTSRLSDSDTSECDITDCDVSREHRRTNDGASISSIGSSSSHYSSPPPEREFCGDAEHRSRRDMSPQSRKRAALMIRDQPASISGYQSYRKDDIHREMMGHRSYSAAPMDSPSIRYRGRSQSPTGHRSLSPPEHRSIPYSHGYGPRFSSRSATATPTGSPKKRQLPLIPTAMKERAVQDLEERARFMRHRNRQVHTTYRSTGMGGWERHYSGLSDSDLPSIGQNPLSLSHSHAYRMHRPRRGHSSPDKDVLGDFGDSDMESIASVTSSAFSTQSERPRGSRGLIPTVKNVLIPGVISPMPPPPRRNRRRHRLRVPCSECHCPNNNPTKPRSNNPGKHNPTPHPLVRSKSAVVRSLYRKMRTPFTRSQTVDENMLRYYSPETSEYTVSEGYILKPEELTGSSKKRIPEIYVEDCLQVDFNDRLIEKFREKYSSPYLLDSGARRRSRSWQDRTAARSAKTRQQLFSRGLYEFTDDLGIRNLDVSLRPRRSFLFSKARSFDYDVLHDAYGDRFGIGLGTGQLSRRAKSFEYENISSNIFSDDSLRTARRKLKRNLSINDAGYGDKIPALGDRSKSYYDSNGDDKIPQSLLHREKNYDYLLSQDHKPFYGYDSELSGGETEIYLPAFDKKATAFARSSIVNYHPYGSRMPGDTGYVGDDHMIGLRDILGREDPTKRKYIDSTYQEHDSMFDRDISSEKRTRNFDSNICDPNNEHIYCSIDEAMSAGEGYARDIVRSSHRGTTNIDFYDNRSTRIRPRRRTKSTDSYLEDDYDAYGNWDIEYDEGFIDRGTIDDYDQRGFDYQTDRSIYDDRYYHHDRMEDGLSTAHRKKSAHYAGDADTYIAGDYSGYRSAEEYGYRTHDETPECCREAYRQDNTFPRRRRRRSRRGSRDVISTGDYENLQPYHRDMIMKDTLTVPSFSESKRMMLQRAESTPVLHSDDDLSSNAERAKRAYRRRRNSSCPETRELRYYDTPRRKDEESSTNFMLQSDEEFGSMETVVGADYFRRKTAEESRTSDGTRTGYYGAEESRGGYVDSRCDYEECRECMYASSRGVGRSSSLRGSSESSRYYRGRRKSSCPECRELAALAAAELNRSGSLSRRSDDRRTSVESRARYRRRNSSCPEARELELLDRRQDQRSQREQQDQSSSGQQQQQQQQQGSKRNVAISDTLEYYEYSMESESQCSENCGFGPCDPRRPHNRAPCPGNANSSLFDSQTATSDTAKNYHPRAADHHENSRNTKPTTRDHHIDDSTGDTYSPTSSTRRRSRKQTVYDDDDTDAAASRDRRSSSMPENSEYSSQSGSYEKTSRHQLTDNGHDEPDKRGQFTRSLSNTDGPPDEKVDGSLSDTAIGLNVDNGSRRGRKSSPGSKSGSGSSSGGGSAVQYQSGLGKKSNSTSQLSATGRKRRLGFGKKGKSSFTVHRSEEVLPEDTASGRSGRQPSSASSDGEGSGGDGDRFMQNEKKRNIFTECGIGGSIVGGSLIPEPRGLGFSSRKRNSTPISIQRSEEIVPIYQHFESGKSGGSAASDTAGSLNSISSSEGSSWSPSLRMATETGPLKNFIKDFGPGQLVGRQALGAACLGEIQLSLSRKNGFLEIEVIRAKDLKNEESKALPASYVKVYLVSGKECIAKAKTAPARATLEPFYKEVLKLPYKDCNRDCILQVTVWGAYGRFGGRKEFMGIAQIVLDELKLKETEVIGWYKLFGNMSL